ncbi:hypothetical protein V8D89_011852 [Ganoderma adspersum]
MPPRRKKQKTAHNPDAVAQLDQDPAEPGSSSSSTTTVATAPSWKGTKRRSASLEKFIDGPVDIVVEVLVWLHPRDLCTLVRTSSVFKNFLLSKDRRQLWKTIIANATDLPPQPPFLSEPAFVHLLYSHHCHNCGTVARQVITEWFKRACSKCIPEVMTYHCYGSEDAYRCSNADINRYLRQLRKIKKNPDQNEREKAYQAIVKEWMKRLIRRQKYSALLKEWFKKEERARLAVLDDKKSQRFTEIVERLQESEWAKEIEFLSDEEVEEMSMLPVVRRSSKLTKSEWSNVLVALDGFLNKTRERRLLGERQAAIRTRLGELERAMLEHYVQLPRTAAMDVRPNYIEFALMDKCKALADAPVARTVTSEDFLAILPELHKKWHTSAKTRLVKAVQKNLRAPSISVTTPDPLNLAITVFVCAHCSPFACMRYPAVLAHACGYTRDDDDDDYPWEDPDEPPKASEVYASTAKKLHVNEDDYEELEARERFSLSKVVGPEDSYAREVLKPMCTMVRALGLDPATTTTADLEACGARLRCTTCAAKGKPDVIYGWEAALLHFREFRRKHVKWKWKRIHGSEVDKVRKLEAARDARPLAIHRYHSLWACALCRDWDGSGREIEAHLLNDHGLEDADACARNGTIYVHPAKNRVLMQPPVILTPVDAFDSSKSAAQTWFY